MRLRVTICLLAVGLSAIATPSSRADFTTLLPDDADGVLTVNVKQILGTPAYKQQLQKQVEAMLQQEPVQSLLKGTGIDPFKDVDRLTMVEARSGYGPEGHFKEGLSGPLGGPLYLIEGNFDAAQVKAVLERMNEKSLMKVTELKTGKVVVWEVKDKANNVDHVAVPVKGVVIVATMKAQVSSLAEKIAAKQRTELKSEAMRQALKTLDTKLSVSWVAIGSMISGTSRSATFSKVGSKDPVPVTAKHERLSDQAITNVTGSLIVGDDLRLHNVLTFKDTAAAEALTNTTKAGIEAGIQFLEKDKTVVPLVDALKHIKVASKDKIMTLEGQAPATAIQALVAMMFRAPK
jgi:hypothetical protein